MSFPELRSNSRGILSTRKGLPQSFNESAAQIQAMTLSRNDKQI